MKQFRPLNTVLKTTVLAVSLSISGITPAFAEEPLKGFPKNYAKFAEEHVETAYRTFASGLPNNALNTLEQAKYQLGKIKSSNPNLMNHSRVVAIQNRIADLENQINGKPSGASQPTATSAPNNRATTAQTPPAQPTKTVTQQSSTSSKGSDKDWEQIINIMSDAESSIVKSAYFTNRQTVEDMAEAFSVFDQSVTTGRDALEGYEKAEQSGQLPKKGRAAYYAKQSSDSLRSILNSYGNRKLDFINKVVKEAKETVASAEQFLVGVDQKEKDLQVYSATQANSWITDSLTQYDIVVKAIGENAPAEVKAEIAAVEQKRNSVSNKIAAIDAKLKADAKAQIAKNRFPTKYSKTADPKVIKAAEKEFGTKILRSAEIAPWEERTEAKWVNNRWVINNFKYYKLWLAKQNPSGSVYVYNMRFRQKQLSPGQWSEVSYYSVGSSYEVLKENI